MEYKHNDILIQYRQAGDCYLLIEYGDSKSAINLMLRMRIHQIQEYAQRSGGKPDLDRQLFLRRIPGSP